MIIVTRCNRSGVKYVLCFTPSQGSYWGTLENERTDGWRNARKFQTRDGATLAAQMEGGVVEEAERAEQPIPGLLQPQAG